MLTTGQSLPGETLFLFCASLTDSDCRKQCNAKALADRYVRLLQRRQQQRLRQQLRQRHQRQWTSTLRFEWVVVDCEQRCRRVGGVGACVNILNRSTPSFGHGSNNNNNNSNKQKNNNSKQRKWHRQRQRQRTRRDNKQRDLFAGRRPKRNAINDSRQCCSPAPPPPPPHPPSPSPRSLSLPPCSTLPFVSAGCDESSGARILSLFMFCF